MFTEKGFQQKVNSQKVASPPLNLAGKQSNLAPSTAEAPHQTTGRNKRQKENNNLSTAHREVSFSLLNPHLCLAETTEPTLARAHLKPVIQYAPRRPGPKSKVSILF